MDAQFDRRVYRREFADVLGCGSTWFRGLEKRGIVPQGRRDPGGKRVWWPASEVHLTLEKMAKAACSAAAPDKREAAASHTASAPA